MSSVGLTVLHLVTPVVAVVTLLMVSVAVASSCWLVTEEFMLNPEYNGTGDRDYLPKRTVSGLWQLCQTYPGDTELDCSNIDYFPKEEYSPDPNDSTMAIPYAVTRAAVFFVSASLLLLCGELCCLCGHLSRTRRLLTFISGVIFIISGLLMLMGLVMYISVFKAEVGSKLRPRSQLQPPMFTFRYGYSFLLYVTGFVTSEVAGTCAVFLYIYWTQRDWARKRLEMATTNHRRKSNSSTLDYDHQPPVYVGGVYQCRRHPFYPPPLLDNHLDAVTPANHTRIVYLDNDTISPQHRVYQCRRHPFYPPPLLDNHLDAVTPANHTRRVYLDNDTLSPQHSIHTGVGVSTVSSCYYPTSCGYPPAMLGPWDPHCDGCLPQPPTDLCDEHPDFVTFDLDDVPPLRPPHRAQDTDTLRRTTPV
ncbi:voltage-dependent calcium channel gamma-4 subunit-like [Macrosteles quadrilineatus]|uniref:voltage-dependent calcium channel gamma-4 subunit-like n=1 Tax=Macrosteles quadrilineatus TaxID=74068 RepID=UPI0023E327E7|nr:voltage-dependent calcium channel gamma-4 subunit-like [Macrosteles quadrilineatus]